MDGELSLLIGGEGVEDLVKFQHDLNIALINSGLSARRARHFTPLVTMMYGDHLHELSIQPISWTVKEFVLLDILVGGPDPLKSSVLIAKNSGTILTRDRSVPDAQKRFSEEQIAFALRQADSGSAVGEICRKQPKRERLWLTDGSCKPVQSSADAAARHFARYL